MRKMNKTRRLRGGGLGHSYTFGAPIIPNLDAGQTVVPQSSCMAEVRPGYISNPAAGAGLPGMGGGGRRKGGKRGRKTQRGGRYGFDLSPQMVGAGYNPNQFATVVGMRGETCTPYDRNQTGGAMELSPAPYPPTMTLDQASYQAAYEVPKTVYTQVAELIPQGVGGNVVPIERNDALGPAQISGACVKTGGRRRSRRSRKGKKASKKSRRHRKH